MFFWFLGISYDFRGAFCGHLRIGSWLIDGLLTTLEAVGHQLDHCRFPWNSRRGLANGPVSTVADRSATAYVEFFRNVPLLVWLFFWYFGAPEVLPESIRSGSSATGSNSGRAVAGISFYHGARIRRRSSAPEFSPFRRRSLRQAFRPAFLSCRPIA